MDRARGLDRHSRRSHGGASHHLDGSWGRPPTAPAAIVDVSVDGQRLGSASVGSPVAPYDFVIPPETMQAIRDSPRAARLEIAANTWNPARLLASKDDRDLGVMVERVLVR